MGRFFHTTQQTELDDCKLSLHIQGSDQFSKVSYPIRTGIYSEIETSRYIFHFNLNHEVIRIIGTSKNWPHPQEWLKRTMGNDWIYYSTGGYSGVFEATGEYYLPNLPYQTNNYLGGTPFKDDAVASISAGWHQFLCNLLDRPQRLPAVPQSFIDTVLSITDDYLLRKGAELRKVVKGRVTVLPPDTRHVDYNIIPVNIAEGCLHKCLFCKVKNTKPFKIMPRVEVSRQLHSLQTLYGKDLINYNSVFLGEHDALHAGHQPLIEAITESITCFNLTKSFLKGCNFFLFGSVNAILSIPEELFSELAEIPALFYINIGLESADQTTLDFLGKPLRSKNVIESFDRCQAINEKYRNIEISVNFVMDETLSPRHYDSMLRLIRDRFPRKREKGCVYLSPLRFNEPSRSKLFTFYRLKVQSRLPLFLYTIQRL